jgi:hypothetical protein
VTKDQDVNTVQFLVDDKGKSKANSMSRAHFQFFQLRSLNAHDYEIFLPLIGNEVPGNVSFDRREEILQRREEGGTAHDPSDSVNQESLAETVFRTDVLRSRLSSSSCRGCCYQRFSTVRVGIACQFLCCCGTHRRRIIVRHGVEVL